MKGPQNDHEAPSDSESSTPKIGGQLPQIESKIKNLQDSKIPDSLSFYFRELKPERKRQSERQALESLLVDYSGEEVPAALEELRRRDPDGRKYHSPMAYLAHAMPQVMRDLQLRAGREESKSKREADRRQNDLADALAEREWAEKEAAFLFAFPTPEIQERALGEYGGLTETVAALGGQHLRRQIAIGRWWESREA